MGLLLTSELVGFTGFYVSNTTPQIRYILSNTPPQVELYFVPASQVGWFLSQHKIQHPCCSQIRIIHRHKGVWEYTGFGTTIGLLNRRTNDCPNIVLYDECHNITSKPRRFPLGTLGTEPVADEITVVGGVCDAIKQQPWIFTVYWL